ncbi:MAG TPA: 30S ribosomal protein S17 [Gammaproteobacteria bacterium]|jgi:small subunit ribosomal protein S17|nr:30S ribosomal protein S17 [Gammaproteobacteria bacterium]
MSDQAKNIRTLTGKVVSNKMDKTITVSVERIVTHATYGKILRRRTKIKAHDEQNVCQEGDVVTITQCRPISRHKSWKLVEVIERAAPAAAQ